MNNTEQLITETTIETTTVVTDQDGNVISETTVTNEGDVPVTDPLQIDDENVVVETIVVQETKDRSASEAKSETNSDTASNSDSNAGSTSGETKKKPKKPLSPAMQRLTAKKQSPELSTKAGPTSDQRKANAVKLRSSKINEHRKQEDDKRAAVLERKRRLEEEERKKKEALLKKITTGTAPKNKQASMKRYSSSTSNLTQLKKTKPIEVNIDLEDGGEKKTLKKPPSRPVSAMGRARPVSTSNLLSRPKSSVDKKPATDKKPADATAKKAPATRQSLAPRPASALGVSATDRRKTLPGKSTATATRPSTSMVSKSPTKPLKKDVAKTSTPTSKTVPVKKAPIKTDTLKPTTKSTRIKSNDPVVAKKDEPKRPASAAAKRSVTSPPVKKTTIPKAAPSKTTASKTSTPTAKKTPSATSKASSTKDAKADGRTAEEAKKLLQERRKKAKEEAEAKARAEREKDVIEQQKREEEEKRLAEQLKAEEERQSALLAQLKVEEEERQKKLQEEKEEREQEERDRLESEAKQRDEEIERKTKIEAERIKNEQQRKDQESEAERTERKKRVELIMARVSATRAGSSTDSPAKPASPPAETATETSLIETPSEPAPESTRSRVDDILKARGLGRSTENLLDIDNEKPTTDETHTLSQEIPAEETPSEESPALVTPIPDVVVTTETEQPSDVDSTGNVTEVVTVEERVEVVQPSIEEGEGEIIKNNEQKTIEIETQIVTDIDSNTVVETVTTTVELNDEESLFSNTQDNNNVNPPSTNAWETSSNDTNASGHLVATEEKLAQLNLDNRSSSLVNIKDDKTEVNLLVDVPVEADVESTEIVEVKGSVEVVPAAAEKTTANGRQDLIDVSNTTEKEQWQQLEEQMKGIQADKPPAEISNEESKMWKLAEGKVELSECF